MDVASNTHAADYFENTIMLSYLIKRLVALIPTVFFVTIIIFGLQQLLPGDPAIMLAGEDQDPTVIAYLHKKMHLDEPDRKSVV